MILGHVFGIPVEENAIQLAPAGAATVTLIAIAGRTKLGQLQRRFRRRMRRQDR
jgi:ABC-type proline/glycine betaine transport system permease subunit